MGECDVCDSCCQMMNKLWLFRIMKNLPQFYMALTLLSLYLPILIVLHKRKRRNLEIIEPFSFIAASLEVQAMW